MIDLHTHSTASDGSLTPQLLVQKALDIGLSHLALTDHDTIAGIEVANTAALNSPLKIITGLELEIANPLSGIFHLLALGFDHQNPALLELLSQARLRRQQRNLAIIDKMQADGINVELKDIAAFASSQIISRPHFADYLVHIKHCRNRAEAFERFLAGGKSYHIPYEGLDLAEAIATIHQAGGKAFLAHPQSLYISLNQLPSYVQEWKKLGLDGIEAWHPGLSYKEALRLETMAQELGILTSAGSDFHGEKRPDRILGKSLSDKRKIDARFLSCLA